MRIQLRLHHNFYNTKIFYIPTFKNRTMKSMSIFFFKDNKFFRKTQKTTSEHNAVKPVFHDFICY
jgi:hypothetical protein